MVEKVFTKNCSAVYYFLTDFKARYIVYSLGGF